MGFFLLPLRTLDNAMNKYLSLVKFSHTIFALPFALLGFFLGIQSDEHVFTWQIFVAVLLCMIFVRSAAMAFNRYIDRDIDAINPRTVTREIPAGVISAQSALFFTILNVVLFIITCYFINTLCFYLSPIAVLITLGYSYTKRFTYLCHVILGMGLALAPVGAYVAVTGMFSLVPVLYGFAVLFWVSGFDIIYALQDDEFDRSHKLHSIPADLGRDKGLMLSSLFHVISAVLILANAYLLYSSGEPFSYIVWIAAIVFLGSLYYQHRLVSTTDLSKVNQAFFMTNGIASLVFGALMIIEMVF